MIPEMQKHLNELEERLQKQARQIERIQQEQEDLRTELGLVRPTEKLQEAPMTEIGYAETSRPRRY